MERTSLDRTGLGGESEGRVLSVSDDLWDQFVVSARQIHLSVVDPLELSQQLLEEHLVWFVGNMILVGEPVVRTGQTGGQILDEEREEQLGLM